MIYAHAAADSTLARIRDPGSVAISHEDEVAQTSVQEGIGDVNEECPRMRSKRQQIMHATVLFISRPLTKWYRQWVVWFMIGAIVLYGMFLLLFVEDRALAPPRLLLLALIVLLALRFAVPRQLLSQSGGSPAGQACTSSGKKSGATSSSHVVGKVVSLDSNSFLPVQGCPWYLAGRLPTSTGPIWFR